MDERLANVHPFTIEVVDEVKQTRQTIDVALALDEMKEGLREAVSHLQEENRKPYNELASTKELLESYKNSHERGLKELKHTVNDSLVNVEKQRVKDVETINNSMNDMKEALNEVYANS
ncbi:hypothetical protein ACJROX_26755 [Pseudalkalibacillus sp. A8]|uniref:hypothetical protein n=1 Tax=Pseudalkalibacillus sp. A8 TaxID=3382641 RepID=UPI0038B661C9